MSVITPHVHVTNVRCLLLSGFPGCPSLLPSAARCALVRGDVEGAPHERIRAVLSVPAVCGEGEGFGFGFENVKRKKLKTEKIMNR